MQNIFQEKIVGTGQMSTKVVGTSYRQSEIGGLCPDHDGFRSITKRCTALLISDYNNLQDCNAILVEIDGVHVGFLDRQIAALFTSWLKRNGFSGVRAFCDGLIVGGWGPVWTSEGMETEGGHYGIRLDFALPGSVTNEQDVDPAAEHVFAPMHQGKICGNVLITSLDRTELQIGSWVGFWINKDNPSFIYLYASGGSGGSSRLGLLPDRFYNMVASHLLKDLLIDASIDRIDSGVCFIRFRLIPKDVSDAAFAQSNKQRRDRLLKPYLPLGPIVTTVFPLSSESKKLKKNSLLTFKRIPTVDEYLLGGDESILLFSSGSGETVYTTRDYDVVRRIIRLGGATPILHHSCRAAKQM